MVTDTVTDTGMFNAKGVTTMGRLANKNILITGGNSGIGLAAAQEVDREGARRHLRLERGVAAGG